MIYYIILGLGQLLSRLPFAVLYKVSDFLSFLFFSVLSYRKDVIEHNLKLCFSECSDEQILNYRKLFYKNFSDLLIETLKSLSISEKQARQRMRLNNPELFEDLHKKGKGIMLVMGHYTNFEWVAMNFQLFVPHACFAVYQRLENPKFNQKVVEIRERFGLKLFQMHQTYPFMLNNATETPLYIFMADQSPHKGKIKYRTRFFVENTPVHLGVENLAKACDLAVVFIELNRYKRGFYEITAHVLEENPKQTEAYQITNQHVAFLEKIIRKKPEDWLWSHKRWKHLIT